MQLKEVLEETKLTKKAIRHYEDCDLLESSRKSNGYKNYSEENVQQLKSIKKLRKLGFSIEEIKKFFESESKKQEVVIRKMNENEKILTQHYQKKELLSALNDGKVIEEIYPEELEVIEEKPYMYLQNIYKVFGWINLISFVMMFLYFIVLREHGIQRIGILVILQSVVIVISVELQKRRSKLKKQGVHVLERKPREMVFQYLANLISYGVSGAIINEGLFFARMHLKDGDYFTVSGNILMGFMFLGLSVGMVFLSFLEDDLDISTIL
ncbi:MerR family transcriptional regulator [Clostridium sp. D2Q-11]|uniref:MerR family transcriptional regulator n=1 Tax=Anaeromonas frigoriresistens TaxID=2683708 RepID=A0A942V1G9_9FIRM|nr:MerR family transcriptional regulator [Anaeromonas frigoriresistens]MBS4539442.1 MerR family transcriptional regulator [Anaeromonas frigoriresistens]